MRWFIAVLAALVLVLQYRIWVSPDGARELSRLADAVDAQREENQKLATRNRQLAAEVRDLKQGFQAVEERARSELGLVAPNETYYQVVPLESPQSGGTPVEKLPGDVSEGASALAAASY